MKFLVLALAVCAANALSVPSPYSNYQGSQRRVVPNLSQAPRQFASASAQSVVNPAPVLPAAKVAPAPAPFAPSSVTPVPVYVAKNNADYNNDIVENFQEINADGSYVARYKTADGTAVESTGTLKDAGGEVPSLVVKGSYEFIADDGQRVFVQYEADENGFRAESPFLPVGPEIPAEIQKSLEYIRNSPKYVDPASKY